MGRAGTGMGKTKLSLLFPPQTNGVVLARHRRVDHSRADKLPKRVRAGTIELYRKILKTT